MRRINKGVPFDDFVKYLDKHKPSKWEDINGDLKSNMRFHMLVNEQDCLCGYSETILEAENTSSHIDHFVKRAHDSNKIFDSCCKTLIHGNNERIKRKGSKSELFLFE